MCLVYYLSANSEGVGDIEDKVASYSENGPGRSPRTDKFSQRNRLAPVPQSMTEALKKAFDNPLVWWIGQGFDVLTKPNQDLQNTINSIKSEIGFTNPLVG